VLRFFIWSAFMLADAMAIYVLGHISVTSTSPEQELTAFWAPFLLLHLGGQDNITAYAIEDNKLWLRHLQTFTMQVAAAAYVLYGESSSIVAAIGPCSCEPPSLC
jgi:amino acid transporter